MSKLRRLFEPVEGHEDTMTKRTSQHRILVRSLSTIWDVGLGLIDAYSRSLPRASHAL